MVITFVILYNMILCIDCGHLNPAAAKSKAPLSVLNELALP